MGIFNSKSDQLEYLEQERKKLWQRVTELEELVLKLEKELEIKTSEPLREAKANSKKTAEFRNKANERLEESHLILNQIKDELDQVNRIKEEINNLSVESIKEKLIIEESKSRIDDLEIEYQKKIEIVNSKIGAIENILIKYPELENKLSEIEEFISKIEENNEKSTITLSSINKRKKEIDDLHRIIFGYEDENESEGTIHVGGLKDELEKSYEALSNRLEESEKEVELIQSKYKNSFEEFEKSHKIKYNSITEEIEQLLPNALTAGLSAAFSKKKEDEETSYKKLQNRFSWGIGLLIAVSILPIAISIRFLIDGISFEEVILRVPRLVLAIIPMYIPILWLAYSASKKLNLSKRLIEEYAHKEVLSKTYEGLAKQISSIQDKEQSEELRYRLLSNFLQVSSENPGKLISNYEASDHPVMEALEQSYKFQIAIDKLEGIPGLSKVAAIIEKNAKKKLDKKQQTIEKALAEDAVKKNNGEEDEEK